MSKDSNSRDLMKENKIYFLNRRKGDDRRLDSDPCSEMSMDLYHRKRRKSTERRDSNRTLSDDYYAYMRKVMADIQRKAKRSKDPA